MEGSKALFDKLMETMVNAVPPETREDIKHKAEKAAEKGGAGMDQLKAEVLKAASTGKQGSEENKKKIEIAFSEFQKSMNELEQKNRQQVITI